jgi:hypothetical protein
VLAMTLMSASARAPPPPPPSSACEIDGMWAQVTNDGVGVSASIRSASGPQGATVRSTQVRDVRRRRQVTVWLRLRLRARVWCVRALWGRYMRGRRRRCAPLPPQQVRTRCQWYAMMMATPCTHHHPVKNVLAYGLMFTSPCFLGSLATKGETRCCPEQDILTRRCHSFPAPRIACLRVCMANFGIERTRARHPTCMVWLL